MGVFVLLDQLVGTDAGRYGECAHIVCASRLDRRDVVGQRAKQGLPFTLPLLTQHGERRHLSLTILARVQQDVVPVGIRRPESVDATCCQRAVRRHLAEQSLSVLVQTTRFHADFRVREDCGKLAS